MIPTTRFLEAASATAGQNTQKAAHQFLEDLRHSKDAWRISSEVLATGGQPGRAYFHAAILLRDKIRMFFDEVPDESHAEIRDSLVKFLGTFRDGPHNVRCQLCLAVADLAVVMPSWTNVVGSLVPLFDATKESMKCMLELMTVLPEEAWSRRVEASRATRDAFQEELKRDSPEALNLLYSVLQRAGEDHAVRDSVFRAAGAWLYYGNIPAAKVAEHPLVASALQAFSREESAESAARVVKDLARSYNSYSRDKPLANMLLSAVDAARPLFARAVEMDDDQLGGAISRATSEVAISYPDVFLMEAEQGQTELLQFIASFVSFPDLQVAEDALPIWAELGWRVRSEERVSEAAVVRCQQVAQHFLQMLVPRLELPTDATPMNEEEKMELSDFRGAVDSALKDVADLLGAHAVLGVGAKLVTGLLQQQQVQQQSISWAKFEVGIWMCTRLSRVVEKDEAEVLPALLQALPQLPRHPVLSPMSMEVVRRYAFWVRAHPEQLPAAFKFVYDGLAEPDTRSAAAQAFSELCYSCADGLATPEAFQHVMAAYRYAPSMHVSDQESLIEGLCAVVGALPYEQIQPALEQVVTPIASQLQRMADPSVTVTDQEALDGLDRLQAVLKHFKPRNLPREKPDPGVELMKSMWDTVSALAARFVGRPEVVESLMLVIRRSINGSTPERWQPLVRPMLQLVSQHFHPQHSPGFLYLIAMAIREFASVSRLYSQSKVPQLTPALAAERDEGHPEMAPMVLGTMDSVVDRTLPLVQSLDTWREEPLLVGDFFDAVKQLVLHCPARAAGWPKLPAILHAAAQGCGTNLTDHTAQSLVLLEDFIELGVASRRHPTAERYRPLVQQFLSQSGHILISSIMEGVTGGARVHWIMNADEDKSGSGSYAKLVESLALQFPQQLIEVIKGVVSTYPPEACSEKERHEFLGDMHRYTMASAQSYAAGEKRDLRNAVRALGETLEDFGIHTRRNKSRAERAAHAARVAGVST